MYDIELRHVASYSVSAFWAAAHHLRGGDFADPQMATALEDSLRQLQWMLESYGEPIQRFAHHAPPLAGQIENNQQLGQVIFRKCSTTEDHPSRDKAFARSAVELEHAFKRFAPNMLDELESMSADLREGWQEWGQQLLTGFAQQTCPQMLTSRADVYLVPQVTGQPSAAFVPYNSVLVELSSESCAEQYADQISEQVFALAWSLVQLNTDLPMYADNLSRGGNEKVGAMASIPAILTTAQALGVGQCTQSAVAERLQRWLPIWSDEQTATTIWNWWQTYINGATTWPVAMIALDRMLHPACQPGTVEFA